MSEQPETAPEVAPVVEPIQDAGHTHGVGYCQTCGTFNANSTA